MALAALAAGPEQGIALEQYELEVANVRVAFERSLAADDIELAGRIAEHALDLGYNWLDYEARGVGGGGVRAGHGLAGCRSPSR